MENLTCLLSVVGNGKNGDYLSEDELKNLDYELFR